MAGCGLTMCVRRLPRVIQQVLGPSAKYGVAAHGQRQERVAGKEGDGGSKRLNWIFVMSCETRTVATGRWA